MVVNIGIVKEPSIDANLKNLLEYVNFLCEGFSFYQITLNDYLEEGVITHPTSFRELKNKIGENQEIDWLIYFTDKRFKNNFFYDEFRGLIIVSFYGWDSLTRLSKNNGIVYFICGLIADAIDENEHIRHFKSTGCIFDFLVNKTGIDKGMKMASICPDCYNRIAGYNKTTEDILLLKNLEILMRELSSASIWDQDIIDFWKSKFWTKEDKSLDENERNDEQVVEIDFTRIIDMIKKMELDTVFTILEQLTTTNHHLYNTIVLLSINWKELKDKERISVIDVEKAIMLRNRIILGVLEIVNQIKMA